ncbi:hypothetical protein DCAR_0727311 [Daucus carota subsp. sativus]|uniref:mitochondrial processing peptidase n=1 Tax=Daucus carota subsp. sativus TaxID=79200 RepID=A0A161ZIE9_DAUCS|nr:PREDICTED: probable mitochondrial-processing peptidase subunit beta, mitochondrial [Daucus carota subsp. sativus]WOH07877.1 hypothetical protein DCAR_0727311 [Daucus carota subsp. sativus]
MASRHLLSLPHRSLKSLRPFSHHLPRSIHLSTHPNSDSLPSPPPPNYMLYDRLAEQIKSKLARLDHPDQRFLQHNSPVPCRADHASALSFPETKITTLPSGIRVATESNLASPTATVGVWIDAGSRYETDEANGVAHFLEHMIFKGTKSRSVRKLEEEIENMGGHLNAYTTREQTTYFTRVMGKDVAKALQILADVLQNSVFDENQIDHERNVILREMDEVEKSPEEVVFDQLHATAFQHSPLGRPILGPVDNIKKITKGDIQKYISDHYAPHRMVVSASGAVKHEEVVQQVKQLFNKLSSNADTTCQLVAKEPSRFTGSEVRIHDLEDPLIRFAVAVEGASWTDPDSIALMVMQSMLGSWNKNAGGGKHVGSQLVERIAIDEIAESMMAFNTNYKDTGLFGIYAAAEPESCDDLAYSIMHAMTKLCYKVSDDDVIRASNQLKSSLLLHLDGTSGTAEDIGRQLITYGRRIPYAELFARIDAVDSSRVKRVAKRFIEDKDIVIAATGDPQNTILPDYNWFRRRTYWTRY